MADRSKFDKNIVNDFTLKLLSIGNKTELLWFVAHEIVGQMGFEDCVIYLLDQQTGKLCQYAAFGAKNPHGTHIENPMEISVGQGVTGHVAKTKLPIIIDDLSTDARYIPDVDTMLSEICVPLIIDQELIGLIDCEDRRQAFFNDDHLDTLTRVAKLTCLKLKDVYEIEESKKRDEAWKKSNELLRLEIDARHDVEKELVRSTAQLSTFAGSTSHWYWEQDKDFKFTDSSTFSIAGSFSYLVGHTRWGILGIDPEKDPYWKAHIDQLRAHQKIEDFRYSSKDQTGKEFVLSVSGEPVFTESGEFDGYRGITSDITKLDHSQRVNDRFMQALDQTSEGLLLWDKDERLIICNEAFQTMGEKYSALISPGMKFEEWLRHSLSQNLVAEAIGREEAWLAERLQYFRNPTASAEVYREGRWYLHRLKKLPDGCTVQSIIDITDQKLDHHRFELATEGAGVGVWESIIGGGTSIWSDSYHAIFGLKPGDITPSRKSFLNMVHPDDQNEVAKKLANSDQLGTSYQFECRIRRKDGSDAWVYSQANQVTTGNVSRWFGILVNIDQQKRAETAKNEFISTMNHELRTPLTAIIGLTELILLGSFGELLPEVSEMLSLSKKNSDQLLVLINDVLEMDRLKVGQIKFEYQDISANGLMSDAVSLNNAYADTYHVKLKVDPDGQRFSVRCDPRRIQQVLANLISNAVKFSPKGATVEISASQDGAMAMFAIKDNGAGIPDDFRSKIFERFTQVDGSNTRKIGGSGLGLSITKTIIETHGGTIDYVSEIGVGTTFTFSIPLDSLGESEAGSRKIS